MCHTEISTAQAASRVAAAALTTASALGTVSHATCAEDGCVVRAHFAKSLHHISVSPHEGRHSNAAAVRARHRKRNADGVSSDEKLRYTDCLRPCAARPMSRARRSRCVLAHARPRWRPPPGGPAASWRRIRRARVALQATPQPAAPPARAIAPPLTPTRPRTADAKGHSARQETRYDARKRQEWAAGTHVCGLCGTKEGEGARVSGRKRCTQASERPNAQKSVRSARCACLGRGGATRCTWAAPGKARCENGAQQRTRNDTKRPSQAPKRTPPVYSKRFIFQKGM